MNVKLSSKDTFERLDAHRTSETRLRGGWLLAARISLLCYHYLEFDHLRLWYPRVLCPTPPIQS